MTGNGTVDIRGRLNFGGLVVDWRIDETGNFIIPTQNPVQALMMVQNINSRLDAANITTANPVPQASIETRTAPPAQATITSTAEPVARIAAPARPAPRPRVPSPAPAPVAAATPAPALSRHGNRLGRPPKADGATTKRVRNRKAAPAVKARGDAA